MVALRQRIWCSSRTCTWRTFFAVAAAGKSRRYLLGWLSTPAEPCRDGGCRVRTQQMTAMFWHWRELFARLLANPLFGP